MKTNTGRHVWLGKLAAVELTQPGSIVRQATTKYNLYIEAVG